MHNAYTPCLRTVIPQHLPTPPYTRMGSVPQGSIWHGPFKHVHRDVQRCSRVFLKCHAKPCNQTILPRGFDSSRLNLIHGILVLLSQNQRVHHGEHSARPVLRLRKASRPACKAKTARSLARSSLPGYQDPVKLGSTKLKRKYSYNPFLN